MAETVTIGGKTYTKPANAKAGWLAAARKTTPVATDVVNTKSVETTATTAPVATTTTTATPIKSSVESKPVQPAIDRESASYKELTSMGYTEQQIIDAASRVKKPTATPQVDVSVEQEKLDKAKAGIEPAVNQQTGTVEGVKLETAKEQVIKNPDYQDESIQRLTELQSNLEQYDKLAPQNFSSYETFKKAFDYNGRAQKQKDVLDSFWQKRSTPVVSDFWAGKSDDDITNSYLSGSLTDKDLSDLYNSNPERYGLIKEKIDKANTYNDANSSLSGDITKFTATESPKTDKTLLEQYEEFMSSSDILKREADLATKKGEIDLIDEKIANMKDTIVAQYEGKGMSGDVLDAIIADRVEALNKDKRTKTIGYNADLNIYNTLVSDAQKKIDLVKEQAGLDSQKLRDNLAVLGFNYDVYKDSPEYITQQYNLKYDLENPDLNSEDPNISKRGLNMSLDKYYEDFGPIILRPKSQVISDVMKLAESEGISVAEALKKNFVEPLQSKDMYGQMLQKSLGIGVEVGGYSMSQQADGNWKVDEPSVISGFGTNQFASWMGNTITNLGSATDTGVDWDVGIGDEITSPVSGILTLGKDTKTGNVYANIKQDDGTTVQLNHLSDETLTKLSGLNGTKINAGTIIGYGGNTGNVKDINGNRLRENGVVKNQSALDAGQGSHVDVRVNKGGNNQLYGQAVVDYLNGQGNGIAPSASELAYFNRGAIGIDPKGKDGLTPNRYNQIAEWMASHGGTPGEGNYDANMMLAIELPEKATEFTKKSFSYGNRLAASNELITDYEDKFVKRTTAGQVYQSNAFEFLKSQTQKSYELYKENFITANLRQESGASIAPTEFEKEEKKYFAQPGDNTSVVEQKRLMREIAIKNMYTQAGRDINGVPISNYYGGFIKKEDPYIRFKTSNNYGFNIYDPYGLNNKIDSGLGVTADFSSFPINNG